MQEESEKMKIHAVIFDMDGLLINTEKYLFRCWKQAAAEAGYELKDEQLLGMRSLAAEFAVPRFREIFGEGFDYAAIRNRRKELMNIHLEQHGIEKKPGVEILLDWLTEHGYKKAVATATDMERTKKYLTEIGICDRFDRIVCAPSVPHGKPMPDVYLHACAQIGEEPATCVALEDSDNGALSAYRAGCKVIMVPDLAEPLPETAKFLSGVASDLTAVIPLLQQLEV
jgi:HAD superfamily hydrolase (TIGR01509 family)